MKWKLELESPGELCFLACVLTDWGARCPDNDATLRKCAFAFVRKIVAPLIDNGIASSYVNTFLSPMINDDRLLVSQEGKQSMRELLAWVKRQMAEKKEE